MIHTNYERLKNEIDFLNQRIYSLEEDIKSLPAGKISFDYNEKYIKWFNTVSKSRTYISKTNRTLSQQLAAKKYMILEQQYLINERNLLKACYHQSHYYF